jgi:hypothetical protein
MPETYVQMRVAADGTLDQRSLGLVARGGQVQPVEGALRTVVRSLRVVPAEVDGIGVTTWMVMRPKVTIGR